MLLIVKGCLRWIVAHRSLVQQVLLLSIILIIIIRQASSNGRVDGGVRLILGTAGSKLAQAKELYRKYKFDTKMEWPDEYTLKNSLLKVPFGPKKGKELESIDEIYHYEGDPRLVWSVYLEHAMSSAASQGESARADSTSETPLPAMPFSWYDWTDHYDFDKLIAAVHDGVELDCKFFFERAFEYDKLDEIESNVQDYLFSYQRVKYYDEDWYKKIREEHPVEDPIPENKCKVVSDKAVKFNLPIQVGELHEDVRPEVYQMQARSYVLTNLKNPLSLTVLEGAKSAFRFPLARENKNMIQSNLLASYLSNKLATNSNKEADVKFDHLKTFEDFLQSDAAFRSRVVVPDGQRTQEDESSIPLKASDFEFDVRAKIKELEKLASENKISQHGQQYLESLKVSITYHPSLQPKYLTEAGHISQFGGMGYHRDKRFFNGGLVEDYQEYQARLNSLIRTWLKFTRANGLLNWVAHGSLYGYLYNGMNFPWDNDYDVQMPIRHLHLLSQYFNQSLVMEDPREGNGRYLVDVGTSITVRTKGNGQNNIDARFIDIDSGLYVDITGLSVSSNPQRDNFEDWYNEKQKGIDLERGIKDFNFPEVGDGLAALNISELSKYSEEHKGSFTDEQKRWISDEEKNEKALLTRKGPQRGLVPKERYYMNREVGAYNCRNSHFITMELASPLVKTVYHGVEAVVPHRVIMDLRKEYYVPEDLGFIVYQGNVYIPVLRSWFNLNILKRLANTRSWNSNLREVKSPINSLSKDDLDPLFENMHNIGYTDVFSLFHSNSNATAYRLKEMEIQYDTRMNEEEKEDVLDILRHNIAPKMEPLAKDATLYVHEKRLWEGMAQKLSTNEVKKITQQVSHDIYEELLVAALDFYDKKSDLFVTTDDAGQVYNFNKIGTTIPRENKLFEKDYS